MTSWQIFKRTFGYTKRYVWITISGALIMIPAFVILTVGLAAIQEPLINMIINGDKQKLLATTKFAAIAAVFIVILCMIGGWMMHYARHKTIRDLTISTMNKINKLPMEKLQSKHSGDMMSLLKNDIPVLVSIVTSQLTTAFNMTLAAIGAATYLISRNAVLGIITILITPLSFLMTGLVNKKMQKVSREIEEQMAVVETTIQEILQGMEEVRVLNLEAALEKDFKEKRKSLKILQMKEVVLNIGFRALFIFIQGGLQLIYAVVVCYLAIKGQMAVGSILAFVILFAQVQGSFIGFADIWGKIQKGIGVGRRVFELMDYEEEFTLSESKLIENHNEENGICIDEIDFGYENDDKLFNKLTINIREGEAVALVGKSGCGKSTLAKLCSGLIFPLKGSVRVFGKESKANLTKMRENIAYISQSPYIFTGTIKENISLGNLEASDEEILNAAKLANAHDFIMELPEGYDTNISEKGSNLSGGQRQRISIARAFLKDTKVVIMDEATSALDNISELKIQQAMEKLMENKTSVIIAHRLSTIENADRILVMDNGDIVEEGTHSDLLANEGMYNKFWIKFTNGLE